MSHRDNPAAVSCPTRAAPPFLVTRARALARRLRGGRSSIAPDWHFGNDWMSTLPRAVENRRECQRWRRSWGTCDAADTRGESAGVCSRGAACRPLKCECGALPVRVGRTGMASHSTSNTHVTRASQRRNVGVRERLRRRNCSDPEHETRSRYLRSHYLDGSPPTQGENDEHHIDGSSSAHT